MRGDSCHSKKEGLELFQPFSYEISLLLFCVSLPQIHTIFLCVKFQEPLLRAHQSSVFSQSILRSSSSCAFCHQPTILIFPLLHHSAFCQFNLPKTTIILLTHPKTCDVSSLIPKSTESFYMTLVQSTTI